jgi:ABC-2 type transport system permease protein
MTSMKPKLSDRLRIVWAITAKDITDASKNKTMIAIALGVAFLMLSSQALPLLLKLSAKPTIVIYDAGRSGLLAGLKDSSDLRLRGVASQDQLEERLGEASGVELGLVIPPDFDQMVGAGDPVQLPGYFAHHVGSSDAAETSAFFEKKLADLVGLPVRILTEGNTVYPAAGAGGHPLTTAATLVLVITTICGSLVPYLMIEEKETHTLDALLVSPASIGQVVTGKALAGTFYGLIAATVAFAFNWSMVAHWDLAILVSVCAILFAVAGGLLLGSLFDNPQSVGLWFGAVLVVLMVPLFLVETLSSNAPQVVRSIVPYIPTVLLFETVRTSFSQTIPWAEVLIDLGIVLACSAVLLGFVAWRMRRSDR